MNETLRVISNRRTIRKYQAEQIKDSELQAILAAAIYAPNALNTQQWHFTVVQAKDMLDRMVDTIKDNMKNSGIQDWAQRASAPGYNTFYNAPTVILISGNEKSPFSELEGGLAAENIALAAESLNIGSCVATSSRFLFDPDKNETLRQDLGIPDGYRFVCSVTLGYKVGGSPAAPPRNRDVINFVK